MDTPLHPAAVQRTGQYRASDPQLTLGWDAGELDAFLLDLDCVLELRNTTAAHLAGVPGPKRPYTADDVARVAAKARNILACAAARGWPAVARLVLPVALADGLPIQEAFAAGGERSLMHLAVRSRSSATVCALSMAPRCHSIGFLVCLAFRQVMSCQT